MQKISYQIFQLSSQAATAEKFNPAKKFVLI